ncbi:MAG: sigma-70 family RNA polymerase sigma factor [Planctomycetota bacterium]
MSSAIETSDARAETDATWWTAALEKLGRVVAARAGVDAIDDVLQEVALAATRSPSLPDGEPDRSRFLVAITLRQAALWLRRKYRDAGTFSAITDDGSKPEAGSESSTSDPAFFLIAAESAETTQACLAKLEPWERDLLTRKYIQRVSYQGIADHFGWTRHVAEYRVRITKEKLRGLMVEVGLGEDS